MPWDLLPKNNGGRSFFCIATDERARYNDIPMYVGPNNSGVQDQWQRAFNLIANKSTQDEGFELLFAQTRTLLTHYLRGLDVPHSDHEDIISTVLGRIWEQRDSLTFSNRAAWFGYVHKCTRNLYMDFQRSAYERHTTTQEVTEEMEYEPSQTFQDELEKHAEYQTLLGVADDHWLGKKPEHFRSRLLAATLLLWDKKRLSVTVSALKKLGEVPVDSDPIQVLDWITHDTVLRTFAYAKVHQPPQRLFEDLTAGEKLDPQQEAVVLWWRFAQFQTKRRILDRLPEERHGQAESLIQNYESRLPFANNIERVMKAFAGLNRPLLADSGVWKRLIFQYKLYALSNDDMVQWFGPSAGSAGFRLDAMTLHGWLYDRRLEKELRRAWQERGEMQNA